MQFEPIKSPSLKDLFVSQLEGMILSGELAVGQKLPPERDLAEQMGVSRTVINTGIAELASKGFIEIRPRKGVFVADYRRTGSISTLISIMNFNGGQLPRREIHSLLELRLALEILCLHEAIPVMTEEGLATLRECLDRLMACQTPAETAEGRFEFGHELDCLSGNTILPLLSHSFKRPIVSLWTEYGKRYGIELLKDHCLKRFEYIEAGDIEGAVAWTKTCLLETIDGNRPLYGTH
ncbi:GntR family transcriptional regulator [Adlercreutzia sp. R25]|uniref:GntR family transcriptional regulator n=1 Tax=Adlercreutzia shanghongiae TaxID=3111773 RepID=A0ABU6IXZ1_9ACTN|nr:MULTISPECIES: GntR family transcriptional regulator [unclassified Adlercreutzia]MEC4271717.1 GntR family transcriptional regulator [Adlercreutzia sp. R25]MEC4294724.1 GntR family transcriptional regulator [Adlercreutzia sp. R22]